MVLWSLILIPFTVKLGMLAFFPYCGGKVRVHESDSGPITSRRNDTYYLAKELSILISKSIEIDDERSINNYQTGLRFHSGDPRGAWETCLGTWRMETLVTIECKIDTSEDGALLDYIDCFAAMSIGTGANEVVLKSRFARYYAINIFKTRNGDLPASYQQKCQIFQGHQAILREYAYAAKQNQNCIQTLFSSFSNNGKLFSPFHPQKSTLKIKYRVPDGENSNGTVRHVQKSCKLVLIPTIKGPAESRREEAEGRLSKSGGNPRPNQIDIIHTFASEYPELLYRMLADPQHELPQECLERLPMVNPRQFLILEEKAKGYTKDVRTFFDQLRTPPNNSSPTWTIIEYEENTLARAMPPRLIEMTLRLLNDAIDGEETTGFLDCSQPLYRMTGNPQCPPTDSVLGLDLFTRVLVGRLPGLWISIRGQNGAESTISSFLTPYFSGSTISAFTGRVKDQNTLDFLKFELLPNDNILGFTANAVDTADGQSSCGLTLYKFHIMSGSRGLFVIVIRDNDMTRYVKQQRQRQGHLSGSAELARLMKANGVSSRPLGSKAACERATEKNVYLTPQAYAVNASSPTFHNPTPHHSQHNRQVSQQFPLQLPEFDKDSSPNSGSRTPYRTSPVQNIPLPPPPMPSPSAPEPIVSPVVPNIHLVTSSHKSPPHAGHPSYPGDFTGIPHSHLSGQLQQFAKPQQQQQQPSYTKPKETKALSFSTYVENEQDDEYDTDGYIDLATFNPVKRPSGQAAGDDE